MGVLENVRDIAEVIKKIGAIGLKSEDSDASKPKSSWNALQFKEKLTFRTPFYYADGGPASVAHPRAESGGTKSPPRFSFSGLIGISANRLEH